MRFIFDADDVRCMEFDGVQVNGVDGLVERRIQVVVIIASLRCGDLNVRAESRILCG